MTESTPVPQQISYNVKQAAAATGLSEWTIRKLVRENKLAARYHGSQILVDAEALMTLYNSLPSEQPIKRECAANRRSA